MFHQLNCSQVIEMKKVLTASLQKIVEGGVPRHELLPQKKREKRRADEQGFIPPPRQLVRKKRTTSALPSTSTSQSGETEVIESAPTPSTSTASAADGEGMETNADDPPTGDIIEIAPVPERKVRAPPPFFINPKGDWRQLVAIAKMHAPSFQSQMAGRFLKVTVADADQYRALNSFLTEAASDAYKEDPEFVKDIFEDIVSNRIDEEREQKEQTLRELGLQKIRLQKELPYPKQKLN
ncbi:hypothetical protein TNCT_348861 [Trichonephila clavata]|uniref:Uncharacterized protein n=1 Tax=Trichonephila clavata TaxID=2740835 RepID=A0A8X6GLP0_TRICU|nr:hypothetical protein TNCT_348861 [Trichonephila clavata]